ncbi:MAG: hypothetical protein ACLTYW_03825 [Collinsella sp.]
MMDKAASAGHSDRCRIVVDTAATLAPRSPRTSMSISWVSLHYRWRRAHG